MRSQDSLADQSHTSAMAGPVWGEEGLCKLMLIPPPPSRAAFLSKRLVRWRG